MRHLSKMMGLWVAVAMLSAGLFVTGCQTNHANQPRYSKVPGVSANHQLSDAFQVGDQVTINYSGTSATDPMLQKHQETIKDDGTITPPYVGPVKAAGKTPGQLQKELQKKYDYYFQNLTVTVLPKDRVYYVMGEVTKPGPEAYLGKTDIVNAISAAGGFTDFANQKKVRVTRANGQTQIVNVIRAIEDPSHDIQIFPGDQIYVPRRFF